MDEEKIFKKPEIMDIEDVILEFRELVEFNKQEENKRILNLKQYQNGKS